MLSPLKCRTLTHALDAGRRAGRCDASWNDQERDLLILDKQLELARHYQALAEVNTRWPERAGGAGPLGG